MIDAHANPVLTPDFSTVPFRQFGKTQLMVAAMKTLAAQEAKIFEAIGYSPTTATGRGDE